MKTGQKVVLVLFVSIIQKLLTAKKEYQTQYKIYTSVTFLFTNFLFFEFDTYDV